ncbi:MAG: HEAT repeat domain-containing protein [Allosphingosinicella sp.]
MIVSERLSAWLADRDARAATAGAVEDSARALRALPQIAAVEAALPEAEAAGADAVIALAAAFMADETAARAAVSALVRAAAADPFFRPPVGASTSEVHSGLMLFKRRALTIQLAVMGADALAAKRHYRIGRSSIVFTGQRKIFRFLQGGGATLSIWEAPEIRAGFSAASSGRCRLVERRAIVDGETLEVDGRRHSFIVDHAPADIVYLQALTPLGAAPVAAEYDSETLELVASGSTDDASSRTQMMLSLLRIMDRQDAAPVFAEVVGADHFYGRWQAMREFLALNAELALPHLKAMAAADPHPEVRAAAAQTLEAFFPDEIEEDEPCPA